MNGGVNWFLFKGIIAPFFILITLVANSAIVVVLSKKNMQTPTNTVLLGWYQNAQTHFNYVQISTKTFSFLFIFVIFFSFCNNIKRVGMAICDFVTILFPAPGLIYMYTLRNHSRPLGPVSFCYIFYFFNETLPSLFHTASIWLTVALAFQR